MKCKWCHNGVDSMLHGSVHGTAMPSEIVGQFCEVKSALECCLKLKSRYKSKPKNGEILYDHGRKLGALYIHLERTG